MDTFSYLLGKQAGGGGGSDIEIHDMDYLFYGGNRIDQVNEILSMCKNIVGFSHAFDGATNLINVDLSGVTISDNVSRQFDYSFQRCTSLVTINLTNFINSFVTNLSGFFSACTSLTTINFSNCDFSNVSSTSSMFAGCSNLITLDLSMFENKTRVIVSNMFQNCTSLVHLDMRKFDFTKTSFSTTMFTGVPSTCEIIVKNDTQKAWFTTNWPSLTNVKTVAEYEG